MFLKLNIWIRCLIRWLSVPLPDFLPGFKTTNGSRHIKHLKTLLPSQRRLYAPHSAVCWCRHEDDSPAPGPEGDQRHKEGKVQPGTAAEEGSPTSPFLGRRRKTYHHHSLIVWNFAWSADNNEIKRPFQVELIKKLPAVFTLFEVKECVKFSCGFYQFNMSCNCTVVLQ